MLLAYRYLFPALWLAWACYWWLGARRTKATERHEPLASRLLHLVPLALVVALLFSERVPLPWLARRFLPWAPWQFAVAAAITAAGLAFTVWARRHLGRNWSATVTIKQDHELIDSGPYALVRHPIYTGLLLAIAGSGFARDDWRGVIAVLLAWAALWRKLRFEERWMRERFGERYAAYCRRVPALVPRFARAAAR